MTNNFRFYILFVILLLCTHLSAQRHDYVWLFGYSSNPDFLEVGGSVMDFNVEPVDTFYQFREMNFDVTNTSMCDTSGNLLFYTNGIAIANSEHEIMENGEGLNPGAYADNHQGSGYILDQGVLSIPKPGSDSLYYLFHVTREYPTPSLDWHSGKLFYTLIDMTLNNGLGGVVSKNQVLIDDILSLGKVSAIKHSNGRDWWMLLRKLNTNKYYSLLVTPLEIINYGIQEIGVTFLSGVGQSVFSPNGKKYIRYNVYSASLGNNLNIYDFDRCTGLLSNPVQTTLVDSAWTGGVAVSSNSKYLYVSSYNYIYQYV